MLSQARPAACEAAGLESLRFGLALLLLACFLGSLLRSVENMGVFCRSVLEERDLELDLREEVDCTRVGGDKLLLVVVVAAAGPNPEPAGGSSALALDRGAGRRGNGGGLDRSA